MTTPQLHWDIGTAYDLFVSLEVLHNPDGYGLRGAWAAGVRSRLPTSEREFLQRIIKLCPWPLHWVHALPAPKNATAVLHNLSQVPLKQRILTIANSPYASAEMQTFINQIVSQESWNESDLQQLQTLYQHHGDKKEKKSKKDLTEMLNTWSRPAEFGEGYLAAMKSYYDVFFAEEEIRILPDLETAVAHGQELASSLPVPQLLEELTQGLRFTKLQALTDLVLAPSFWATPLAIFMPLGPGRELFLFGGRPSKASLIPGELVPDALFQALKALADPTRLRIMRYLSAEPLTPAELSRRLRLRAPTVIHHLHALRLARLVHLTLGHEGRRYEARREAVTTAFHLLDSYLDSAKTEKK